MVVLIPLKSGLGVARFGVFVITEALGLNPFEVRARCCTVTDGKHSVRVGLNPFEVRARCCTAARIEARAQLRLNPFEVRARCCTLNVLHPRSLCLS